MESLNIPKSSPALHSMIMDDENKLWVSTIVNDPEVYKWWVLDETGKLLSRFTWPRDKEIRVIKNDYLYTIERNNKTDVESVVRYKINFKKR